MTNQIVIREKDVDLFLEKIAPAIIKNKRREYQTGNFTASVVAAVRESRELQECLKTPEGQSSMRSAICKAAVNGLSVDPVDNKAALIAYKGKVGYQIMKDGLIQLAQETGRVDIVKSEIVREADIFEIEQTTDGDKYKFVPARRDRGSVDGYVAACKLRDGSYQVKYVSRQEALEHGRRYASSHSIRALLTNRVKPDTIDRDLAAIQADKNIDYKLKDSNWIRSFDGMGVKTALKALFSSLYLTSEFRNYIQTETIDSETGEVLDASYIDTESGYTSDDVKNEMEPEPEPAPEVETENPDDFFAGK